MNTTTIGVDLAKSVFRVSLATQPQSELVFEACATAHHWARTAKEYGHATRLLHAQYVRAYVRRNKTDAADADALVRARRDPDLKPVPVKSVEQQALQSLHRIRSQWQSTRQQRICLARSLLAEFGIHLPTGASGIVGRLRLALEVAPTVLVASLESVIQEITEVDMRIKQIDQELAELAKHSRTAQQLLTIPGIGVITATALLGSVPDIHSFRRARQFSAWLGLTPREYSSGSTRRLGGISKRGDNYLRMLLTHGARSALLLAHRQATKGDDHLTSLQRWVLAVECRTNHNKATIALANKMARIVWSVWTKEEDYQR